MYFCSLASLIWIRWLMGKQFQIPRNNSTISIVDDDEIAREATADLLSSLGFQPVTFDCAETFLQSAEADHTSCLITDLQMPGLNGLELQTRLIATGREIPIIFVTAYWQKRDRQQALNAGAVAFLSKPYLEESLLESLQVALKSNVI
jgi:FixJ family two-component response regulator